MRNAEGINDEVINLETGAGGEDAAIKFGLELKFEGFAGGTVAINGDVELGGEADEAVDVIRMFVGDEDAGQSFGGAADTGQPLTGLPGAETGVNKNAGLTGFQVRAVAGGTAAENRELYCHGWTVIGRDWRGNYFLFQIVTRIF
jgi:hypothetical protein